MSTHWRKRPPGFTRVELLLALAILASVCISGYFIYEVGQLLRAASYFFLSH